MTVADSAVSLVLSHAFSQGGTNTLQNTNTAAQSTFDEKHQRIQGLKLCSGLTRDVFVPLCGCGWLREDINYPQLLRKISDLYFYICAVADG